jgi:hypothetical protein
MVAIIVICVVLNTMAVLIGHSHTEPNALHMIGFDPCNADAFCFMGIEPGITTERDAFSSIEKHHGVNSGGEGYLNTFDFPFDDYEVDTVSGRLDNNSSKGLIIYYLTVQDSPSPDMNRFPPIGVLIDQIGPPNNLRGLHRDIVEFVYPHMAFTVHLDGNSIEPSSFITDATLLNTGACCTAFISGIDSNSIHWLGFASIDHYEQSGMTFLFDPN